jgi:hypothetical protein
MSHRAVRVFLWLLACAAIGAAGYFVVDVERRIESVRSTQRVFEAQTHEAAVLVERLRGAQQAYVAEGQGAAFWMGKVTDAVGVLGQSLGALERTSTADASRSAAQAASNALADFDKMDRRARDYVQSNRLLMASDLIFTESLGATTALALDVDHARTEQQAASEREVQLLQDQQMYALIGAAAVCLSATLFLVPLVRPTTPQDTRDALRALIADGAPAGGTLLRPEPAVAKVVPASPPTAAAASVNPAAVARASAPEPPPRPAPTVDLSATARLCSDMARVLDPADLPRLLDQAATLLDASGLIVWVADRSGTALFPTLTHGYGPAVLARMTSIPREADNAAAAAWRLGELRTVTAQGQAPGALVTPIVTAEGCVGVLAAETRNGSEHDESKRAVSRILAAQLATFVTTVPTADQPVDTPAT